MRFILKKQLDEVKGSNEQFSNNLKAEQKLIWHKSEREYSTSKPSLHSQSRLHQLLTSKTQLENQNI